MKKLAFILELENGAKLVSQLSDIDLRFKALSKEIRETEKELNTFATGSAEQRQALEKEGKSIEQLEIKYKALKAEQIDLKESKRRLNGDIRDQIKLFDDLGKKVPDDSLIGLRRRYRELRKEIDGLGKEARALPENIAKIREANQVKNDINEMGKAVGDFREQVGSYEKAITTVFEKFGIGGKGGGFAALAEPVLGLIGGGFPFGGGGILEQFGPLASDGTQPGLDETGGVIGQLTGALGPQGLLATAGAATLIATAGYVADITQEFEILFQKVGQVSNATGQELVTATATIQAISQTYQVEFDEILQAANATSKAFNSSINDTLGLIQQGLAGGANFNQEFLDSLREYPRLIKEAELSQEQFFEILIRSNQEGIYSDKGIDAVKEGALRIREQTDATRKALTNAFGKEATDELLEGVNTGAVTTFEAIQQVSAGLSELDLTAEQTGAVLADVFGGPGEDAGLEFVKTLKDVNGELEDVVNTTDVYTQIQNRQFESTLRLTTAQANLASQFAGSGTNLRTLGTDLKGFGTNVLDTLLLKVRAVKSEFESEGFLAGAQQLAATAAGLGNPALLFVGTDGEQRLRRSDQEALRQVEEGEAKAEAERIARNKRGANGIAGLREEQAKLTQAIQDAKAKGEPYNDLLKDYEAVTKRLTDATSFLNKTVSESKRVREGEIGSLKQLQDELNEVKQTIETTADPSQALLADRDRLIREVKEQQDKINGVSKEGQIKKAKEDLKFLQSEAELQARLTIDNEKLLQAELRKIKIEGDIAFLNKRLELEDENSKERLKIEQELQLKKIELADANTAQGNVVAGVNLDDAVATAQAIARRVSETEEELNVRLENIQLLASNKRIERRLETENLLATERQKLEEQVQQNLRDIELNDINLRANQQQERLDQELADRLTRLANEVESLEEYENQKTAIVLEAELERLEGEKARRLEAGEELLTLDQEIAEKRLQIEQELNKDIIADNKKRIAEQKKFDKQLVDTQVTALHGIGQAFGEFFADSEKDQEDFAKASLITVLDAVEKTINLYLAQLLAKEIASKSFAGIATAAVLSGIVRGAFGVARASISANEEGAILMPAHRSGTITRDVFSIRSHTPGDLTRGAIFQGYSHASKGEHFRVGNTINEAEYGEAIINKKSTQKFKGLLSAINSHNGWGRAFEDGALLGDEIGNITPVSPSLTGAATITDSQMMAFAEIVARRQAESLTPIVEDIVNEVITGLDESNRLKERQVAAQKNGQV